MTPTTGVDYVSHGEDLDPVRKRPARFIYARHDVEKFWRAVCAQGRHKHRSDVDARCVLGAVAREFVLVRLPLDRLAFFVYEPALAPEYAAREGEFPPAIGELAEGFRGWFVELSDGNHRAKATELRGDKHLLVFVSLGDFWYLKELVPGLESLDAGRWLQEPSRGSPTSSTPTAST